MGLAVLGVSAMRQEFDSPGRAGRAARCSTSVLPLSTVYAMRRTDLWADRSMKTALKQRLRSSLGYLNASIAKLPDDDRWRPVLADYALAIQTTYWKAVLHPRPRRRARV